MTSGALRLAEPVEVDLQDLFLRLSTREPELPRSLAGMGLKSWKGPCQGDNPSKLFVGEEAAGSQRERERENGRV